MQHIQEMVEDVLNDSQPTVLATIIHVDGSAYRKEGTWMILKRDDTRIGLLSGGCLESDVHSRVQTIFNTGMVDIYQYDLSAEDDLGWGVGAGCNGVITVLAHDVDSEFRQSLSMLKKQLRKKEPVLFIQSLDHFKKYTFIDQVGNTFGNWDGDFPVTYDDILNSTSPFCRNAKRQTIGVETFFIHLIWPKPNLYIVGAGEDAKPLAHIAAKTGFAVHMLDWRKALCTDANFPLAESFQVGEIEPLIKNIPFSPLDSIVMMTHDFQRDRKVLHHLKDLQLFYIGVLGSKKRTERLMGGPVPEWLHSPVGLSIGAEGPEEIAISIVAELIDAKRRRNR